uniref:DUF668 domain-containing protein n=1 Tax=Ananas comosus var. bracteatus TaxID=296719 RepID=A0A6V7QWP7_ANACO
MKKPNSESWLGRVGLARGSAGAGDGERASIGVLAFEAASLMSKTAHLWYALDDASVARLRDDFLHLEGVRKLVSDDDDFLLGLALDEMADSLGFLTRSVARLGRRCSDPLLRRFDRLFADLTKSGHDPYGLRYAGKKMERKVKKMERLVAATSDLYQELEVLAELEQALRRVQPRNDPRSIAEFAHKVVWQRQQVKYLRGASLWGRTYDYAVRLLARSLFTILARIKLVFGFEHKGAADPAAGRRLSRSHSVAGLMHSSVHPSDYNEIHRFSSGPLGNSTAKSGPITSRESRDVGKQRPPHGRLHHSGKGMKTRWPSVGAKPFKGCMAGGSESPVLQSCISLDGGFRRSSAGPANHVEKERDYIETQFRGNFSSMKLFSSLFESKSKLLNAPESTLGAAALALHYANVIIVIEKLAASPHLIGPDARDDLYNMLPMSIRSSLRTRLKIYARNLAAPVYDPALAVEWTEAITRILEWLAPLAHNMIRWQSERNFEQQHVVSSTNVLLLQTLYYANQMKTEAAITELLVGLNYLWRHGRELNAKAILECVSGRDFDDCFETIG